MSNCIAEQPSKEPNQSLWAATAVAAPYYTPLNQTCRAQVAIVGAGYTGLSAALHLGEAGRDVVIIDAESPGWGASGRNGGQVIPGLKYDPETLKTLFPGAQGSRLVEAIGSAPDLVFSLIERHRIACHALRAGWLQLAPSAETLAALAIRAAQWRAEGASTRLLDQTETARRTGSSLYVGALFEPRGGTLHPLSYARGLAAAAQKAGVHLFGKTPATGLRRTGKTWQVETPNGVIDAETVILATNACADELHPSLRRSVVAIPSFQIATEKLPDAVLASILPGRESASDMRRLLRYFRIHDGRLLMGARGSFAEGAPPALLARMRAAIAEIFPQAAEARTEYAWGGMVAVTQDHLPHLHEPEPGLLAGLGYNGRGVAMATLMGQVLADRAQGMEAEALKFPLTPLRPIKLHRFSRLGARATIAYLRLRDRLSG